MTQDAGRDGDGTGLRVLNQEVHRRPRDAGLDGTGAGRDAD